MINTSEDFLEPIVEHALFSGAIEEACQQQRERLSKDTEWATPRYHHIHDLVTAFAVGCLQADMWHDGYTIPPNFENIINWVAFCIQKYFDNEEVPKVSLFEIRDLYMKWASENPHFLEWNKTDKLINFVTRNSPVPKERDFIDLDALVHNAALFLRDKLRKNNTFDKKFDEEWAQDHNVEKTFQEDI